jgi:hypothetical protein
MSERTITVLERIGIVVASLAVSIVLIGILSGFFTSRDQAGVRGINVPGLQYRDLGHVHLKLGDVRPPYDSNPPTSGAHFVRPVKRDMVRLSDDQLLTALEAGDVVIFYGARTPPPGLTQLVRKVAYQFTPELAAAGQAIILAPRPRTAGLVGVSWGRLIRVGSPASPALREFAKYWLGIGANQH